MAVSRPTVLVTGAGGMVGSALVRALAVDPRYDVDVVLHRNLSPAVDHVRLRGCVDLAESHELSALLNGADVVIHTAARVHVMNDSAAYSLALFRRVNTAGTINLVRQAAAVGVKRFIYLSTIKVLGELTSPGRPFSVGDLPAPAGPYAQSKYEAEEGLKMVAAETGLEFVIVRPPLLYGPGVKGNFLALLKLVRRGLPLPLKSVGNSRTLLALPNLVDLLVTCVDHQAAANRVFPAGDSEDLSTPELIERLGRAFRRKALLLPFPEQGIRALTALLGQGKRAARLLDSLRIDSSYTCKTLNWRPPLSVDEGLKLTADWFLEEYG